MTTETMVCAAVLVWAAYLWCDAIVGLYRIWKWSRVVPTIQPIKKLNCGRLHLGRCLINGDRRDGSRGPICTHCGNAMTNSDRETMALSYARAQMICRQAVNEAKGKQV